MHRLVIWGFALALVPLSLALVWELVALVRAAITGESPVETTASLPGRERTFADRN